VTPLVCGLDLSMGSTGVAYTDATGAAATRVIKPRTEGDYRLQEIVDTVHFAIANCGLVLIEGFLNKSFSAGITGMVHGAVRGHLLNMNIKYATLPPTSLKKYATGKGGASKIDMAVAAFKRGNGAEFSDDNQCDAWWLWHAAMEHMGYPVLDLPALNRSALKSIKMEV
jgi:Holliday junction resolvasome RuvABC endonuclease subunit